MTDWIRSHFVAALTLIIVAGCDRGGPFEGPDGGLTLTVEGFPTVRLQRLSRAAAPWTWPTASDVALTPDEAIITVGCNDQDEFARFIGTTRVQAEGGGSAMTTLRLMMYTPDDGLLHWEMGPPLQSSGLFAVSRAR